jgi:hypothetical protein
MIIANKEGKNKMFVSHFIMDKVVYMYGLESSKYALGEG